MSKAVVVQYETTAETADENQRLIEDVYAELAAKAPDGFHYATFRLADGRSFVHVAVVESDCNPLTEVAAFAEFQRQLGERVPQQPRASDATIVGAYRFLG
jgi:hypothetical protein